MTNPTVHIARNGVVMGRFPPAEVRARLASGHFLRSDHYWIKGMAGWELVSDVFDGPAGKIPPALPASPPALPPALPPVLPAGNNPKGISKACVIIPVVCVALVLALMALFQVTAYFTLKQPLARAMRSDERNQGIVASAYYRNFLPGGEVVLNIDGVGRETKNVDLMRVILQFAATQQHETHDRVILAFRGEERFMMTGEHFRKLGREYGVQNPMYTMRTLPENLYRMDGRRAFPSWEGGALGVMAEQMKNFSEFIEEWLR